MQQLSRTCMVADHYSKPIEYVCIYPECNLSRFLCSKCLLGNSHKHNQQDNSHVLDNGNFYEKMKIKLNDAKENQQYKKYDIENSFVPLRQIIQEVQNLIKTVENIIQQLEQGNLQIFNMNDLSDLEKQLLNVQQHGFYQINDQSLNNLINLNDLQQNKHIYKQLKIQSNLIISNAEKIKLWRLSQVGFNETLKQKIREADYQIKLVENAAIAQIHSTTISNDLKYIVLGRDDGLLKIWDNQKNNLIKQIQLQVPICGCKFTDDDTFLYVGFSQVYQFDVKNQFEKLSEKSIHVNYITNIICISNTIVLTSSIDKTIIKTDFEMRKQLFQIVEPDFIFGLDYNKILNVIASGSNDNSIKIWNGEDGTLLIEKINAHNNVNIQQVLFILNNNQLISLDCRGNLMIWNINYETKLLKQQKLIPNYGLNISLVQSQQYIIAIGLNIIRVHSIQGEFVREINHEVFGVRQCNTIQNDSMKVVLILGFHTLCLCKFDVD